MNQTTQEMLCAYTHTRFSKISAGMGFVPAHINSAANVLDMAEKRKYTINPVDFEEVADDLYKKKKPAFWKELSEAWADLPRSEITRIWKDHSRDKMLTNMSLSQFIAFYEELLFDYALPRATRELNTHVFVCSKCGVEQEFFVKVGEASIKRRCENEKYTTMWRKK